MKSSIPRILPIRFEGMFLEYFVPPYFSKTSLQNSDIVIMDKPLQARMKTSATNEVAM